MNVLLASNVPMACTAGLVCSALPVLRSLILDACAAVKDRCVRLQANFTNGRVEEFLLDQAINAEDMQSAPIAFCVATAMAHFHFSPLILSRNGVAPKAILWDRIRAWAKSVQQHYSATELKALGLQNMLHEVRCLSRCNVQADYGA